MGARAMIAARSCHICGSPIILPVTFTQGRASTICIIKPKCFFSHFLSASGGPVWRFGDWQRAAVHLLLGFIIECLTQRLGGCKRKKLQGKEKPVSKYVVESCLITIFEIAKEFFPRDWWAKDPGGIPCLFHYNRFLGSFPWANSLVHFSWAICLAVLLGMMIEADVSCRPSHLEDIKLPGPEPKRPVQNKLLVLHSKASYTPAGTSLEHWTIAGRWNDVSTGSFEKHCKCLWAWSQTLIGGKREGGFFLSGDKENGKCTPWKLLTLKVF